MISKNILSIGMELEGGLAHSKRRALREITNCRITGDGSVDVNLETDEDYDSSAEVTYWSEKKSQIEKFVTTVFEDSAAFMQNESCGNHIHIKFKDSEKAVAIFSMISSFRLFVKEFKKYAKNKPFRYGRRLNNHYCSQNANQETLLYQLQEYYRCDERYYAINLNSFKEHGTIEFRIMPYCQNAAEFMANLEWLIKVVEKILRKAHESEAREFYFVSREDIEQKEKRVHKTVSVFIPKNKRLGRKIVLSKKFVKKIPKRKYCVDCGRYHDV